MIVRGYAKRASGLLLAVLLAGCVSVPQRAVDDGAALRAQIAREALIGADPDWQFVGRIAVSADGHGGSGRIDWRQSGEDLSIQLSAPVTRRSWRLSRVDGWARLDGLDEGPLQGDDAAQMLRQRVGWDVPLAQMSWWVRGLRARGAAQVNFAANALPTSIEQDGWSVQYRDWTTVAGQPMPARLFARRGDASVRLVIDRWLDPADGQP